MRLGWLFLARSKVVERRTVGENRLYCEFHTFLSTRFMSAGAFKVLDRTRSQLGWHLVLWLVDPSMGSRWVGEETPIEPRDAELKTISGAGSGAQVIDNSLHLLLLLCNRQWRRSRAACWCCEQWQTLAARGQSSEQKLTPLPSRTLSGHETSTGGWSEKTGIIVVSFTLSSPPSPWKKDIFKVRLNGGRICSSSSCDFFFFFFSGSCQVVTASCQVHVTFFFHSSFKTHVSV